MSNSKIKIQSCTLMALTAGLMLSLGSQAVFAQGCVTSPPQPAECYHSISVGVGEFSWNWPPPGALLICPDGIPLGFGGLAHLWATNKRLGGLALLWATTKWAAPPFAGFEGWVRKWREMKRIEE